MVLARLARSGRARHLPLQLAQHGYEAPYLAGDVVGEWIPLGLQVEPSGELVEFVADPTQFAMCVDFDGWHRCRQLPRPGQGFAEETHPRKRTGADPHRQC